MAASAALMSTTFESMAAFTPPTTLPSSFAVRVRRSGVGGGRSDPEDDIDAVVVDLDALDQGPDQVALERPVDLGHPSPHPLREVLEPADDQRQCPPQGSLIPQGRGLLLPAFDPLPEAGDARLELGLVDQAVGVAVDEPRRGAAQLRDLGFDHVELRTVAGTAPAVRPRTRRGTSAAVARVGPSPRDRREVLQGCGWSGVAAALEVEAGVQPVDDGARFLHGQEPVLDPFFEDGLTRLAQP